MRKVEDVVVRRQCASSAEELDGTTVTLPGTSTAGVQERLEVCGDLIDPLVRHIVNSHGRTSSMLSWTSSPWIHGWRSVKNTDSPFRCMSSHFCNACGAGPDRMVDTLAALSRCRLS